MHNSARQQRHTPIHTPTHPHIRQLAGKCCVAPKCMQQSFTQRHEELLPLAFGDCNKVHEASLCVACVAVMLVAAVIPFVRPNGALSLSRPVSAMPLNPRNGPWQVHLTSGTPLNAHNNVDVAMACWPFCSVHFYCLSWPIPKPHLPHLPSLSLYSSLSLSSLCYNLYSDCLWLSLAFVLLKCLTAFDSFLNHVQPHCARIATRPQFTNYSTFHFALCLQQNQLHIRFVFHSYRKLFAISCKYFVV